MESLNLQNLQDYSDEQDFLGELANAEEFLDSTQSKAFFRIILSHFEETVPENIGTAILTTLSHVLSVKKHMDRFAGGSFALKLPFKQKNLTDPLLDLFFVIFTRCPELVTEDVAYAFSPLIVRRPKKTLVLISIYCQFFDELENPWPLVDMLFNGEQYFTNEECCADFLNLLTFLCREFPSFREGRYHECAEISTRCLKSDDVDVIESSYNCLATICSHKDDIDVPVKQVRIHIRAKDVQESVINFLMVAPHFDCANAKFLKHLLKIAQDNVNATLVLMKIATDDEVAQMLVDDSRWMNADLPTPEDTFRLFLVVFSKKNLRNKISRTPEFVDVLQSLVDFKQVAMLIATCTILRRVKLTVELVKRLSSQTLIASFLETADEIGTPDATYASILLCDTITKVCFTKEFTTFCEVLVETCESEDENFSKAVTLAIDFCQHEKCCNKLRKCRMSDVLKKSEFANKKKVKELIAILDDNRNLD